MVNYNDKERFDYCCPKCGSEVEFIDEESWSIPPTQTWKCCECNEEIIVKIITILE